MTVTFSLALPGGGGADCREKSDAVYEAEGGVEGRAVELGGGLGGFRERKGETEERRKAKAEAEDIVRRVESRLKFAARSLQNRIYFERDFEVVSHF